jgi:hypothetical protein
VGAEISILYHIDQRRATDVVGSIGPDYELSMILPVFRAVAGHRLTDAGSSARTSVILCRDTSDHARNPILCDRAPR